VNNRHSTKVLTGHSDIPTPGLRPRGCRFQFAADSKEQSMKSLFSWNPVTLVLMALTVLTVASSARAVERPHVSRGTAQFANANDFVGTGAATHLGAYDEVGSAQFSPTADSTVLQVDAWSIYTAANGDQLYAVFSGHLNGLTGAITATVTYVGGTGRFTNASGTAALSGQLLPRGSIKVAMKGTINY
jgi:hypothetical protein